VILGWLLLPLALAPPGAAPPPEQRQQVGVYWASEWLVAMTPYHAYEFNTAPGVHVRQGLFDHRIALVLGLKSAIGSGTKRVDDNLGHAYFLSYALAIGRADAIFRITPELGIGEAVMPFRDSVTHERRDLTYWFFATLAPEFRVSALLQTSVAFRVSFGESEAAVAVGPRLLFVF